MSKRKQAQNSLRNEIKRYDTFLKGAAIISGLVPAVEQRKREAEAKLLFFTHMPDSIIAEFGDRLYGEQKYNEEQTKLHLPVLPAVSRESIRVLSTGTSSSSDYMEITQTYRRSSAIESSQEGTLHFQGLVEPAKVEIVHDTFSKLAEERARNSTLPPRLNRINKNLAKKFKVAQQSYDKAKNGIVGIDQAAIQLRDVLEQLWGGLVILIRKINPRKYNKAELKLNATGKTIAIDCLAADDIAKKRLTELLAIASKIHNEISDADFGKNPLTRDMERLTELYDLWKLVVTDVADYVYLNIRIKGSRVILKKADST
jgi:hypothetical protein